MSKDSGSSSPTNKRLQGVKVTPKLAQLLRDARALPSPPTTATPDAQTTRITAAQATLAQVPISDDKELEYLSMDTIQAMESLLSTANRAHKLEEALLQTTLHFSQPPRENARTEAEEKQFQQRLCRLRLKQEESRYAKLTSNLGKSPLADDHVTVKSMTYAASIGLNMIVAPLSFGCLMYFFGGTLLNYLWPLAASAQQRQLSHGMDIRKVIIGVVSGVMMLFIEMILFVIRTNELDKAVRKKERKARKSPFSVYQADSRKTYTGERGK